jgi:GT2 family glycosyltransferase
VKRFAIKAEVRDPRARTFTFRAQKTMYGGRHIAEGSPSWSVPGDESAVERELAWVCGASMLASAAFIREIGLMQEDYFLYYEEVDWLLRARRMGWETWYVPSTCVTHRWGASTKQLPDAALRYLADCQHHGTRSRCVCCARH